jgi:hypothetical protein
VQQRAQLNRRHTWSQKHRPDIHHTIQRCWDCGITKTGRHENGQHWTEFHDTDGKRIRIEGERTPNCEGVE